MTTEWLKEGHFVSFDGRFFWVVASEMGRFAHPWSTVVGGKSEATAEDIENLKPLSLDRLFQCAMGMPEGLYAYIKIPTDKSRYGTDKLPEQTSANRQVGWVDYTMSPFEAPSLEQTEFFTQKVGNYEYPRIILYNKTNRRMKPTVRFEVNRMILQEVTNAETVDKLKKKLIPCRPVTLTGLPSVRSGRG